MLSTIELENYRRFEKYRLTGLSRVNLLVGKNNCGKSSLLEAVHLLASGGNPAALAATAWRRGEIAVVYDSDSKSPARMNLDLVHLFHGHKFQPGVYFTLRSDDFRGELTVRVVNPNDPEFADLETGPQQLRLFSREIDEEPPALAIRFEWTKHPAGGGIPVFPAGIDGTVPSDLLTRYQHLHQLEQDETTVVNFVAPDSLNPPLLDPMWDDALRNRREGEVIDAMRILEPGLVNLFFLSARKLSLTGGFGGILLDFGSPHKRVPIGTHGEGMRRLLVLSLSLIQAQNGVLLVDEIDTGLHYSIMGDVWRLVTEVARRSNVQVFATTHSFDCVRGLAWLCENHPDLRSDVSLQKIEPQLEEAVALDAEKIMLAVNRGLEVR